MMDTKQALLIINPISGTSNKKNLDVLVTERLAQNGIKVDTVWTKAAGDATNLAREAAANGYDIVIAAGGDGTINETATALCDTGVTLGIIPCGSGNGLARHLNIPVDVRTAIDIIADGRAEICDHGSVNGRPFFCTFGTGFDAAVSHKFAKSKHRGKYTYLRNTFKEYITYKPEEYVIRANGNIITEHAFVVAVCNASQYGNNAYIAPNASINDGLLDVTIIHYGNILSTALVGLDLMLGSIEKNMLIHTFRAHDITIERKNPGPAHIDGEPLILDSCLDVKCHEHSLSIFTPGCDTPIRPLLTPMMSIVNGLGLTIRSLFKK